MYHTFCITSLCSKKNRCVTCGEIFHPGWWWSFGFRDLDAELQEKAIELDHSKVISDMKLSFQEDNGVQVTNWCLVFVLRVQHGEAGCLVLTLWELGPSA